MKIVRNAQILPSRTLPSPKLWEKDTHGRVFARNANHSKIRIPVTLTNSDTGCFCLLSFSSFALFFFFFLDMVLYSPHWSKILCVAPDDLELLILLPLSPKWEVFFRSTLVYCSHHPEQEIRCRTHHIPEGLFLFLSIAQLKWLPAWYLHTFPWQTIPARD